MHATITIMHRRYLLLNIVCVWCAVFLLVSPTHAEERVSCVTLTKLLKRNAKGAEVKALNNFLVQQALLKESTQTQDTFTNATARALTEWQREHMKTTSYTKGVADSATRNALRCKKTAPVAPKKRFCLIGDARVQDGAITRESDTNPRCSGEKVRCERGTLIYTRTYEEGVKCNTPFKDNFTAQTVGSFFALDFVSEHTFEHVIVGAGDFFQSINDGRFFFKILFTPDFVWSGYRKTALHYHSNERDSAGVDSKGARSFTHEQFQIPSGTQNLESMWWSPNLEWLVLGYMSLAGDSFASSSGCTTKKTTGCAFVNHFQFRFVKNWELPDAKTQKSVKLGMWNATPAPTHQDFVKKDGYSNNNERFIGEAWYYPRWDSESLKRYIDTSANTYPQARPSERILPLIRDDATEVLIVRIYGRCGMLDTPTPDADCRVFADYIFGKNFQGDPIGLIALLQGVTPHPDNWPEQVRQKKTGYWGLYSMSIDAVSTKGEHEPNIR